MKIAEKFNSYTHLAGAVASAIGFFVLLYLALTKGDPWKIVSFTIYGATLFLLYTSSTLYHSVEGKLKRIFQKMDHVAIYLLIAGSYTPFALVTLRGDVGWSIFAVIWGLATLGIIIDLIPSKGHRIFPLIIYLMMGWMAILIVEPLMDQLSREGFYWLAAGGFFYTAGVLFYVMDTTHRLAHGIWHLFVLAGSFAHFVTVVRFVA
ncbi:MAG: PAQR family membrane homeostasis protein TrhA [Balneolaceae bacterium]